MKITYERISFAKGSLEKIEREIDERKVFGGNALFDRLKYDFDAVIEPEKKQK